MMRDGQPPTGLAIAIVSEEKPKVPEEDLTIKIIENNAGLEREYFNIVLVCDTFSSHHITGVTCNLRMFGTMLGAKLVKLDSTRTERDAYIVQYCYENGVVVREEEIARRIVVNVVREHYQSIVMEGGKRIYQMPKAKQ